MSQPSRSTLRRTMAALLGAFALACGGDSSTGTRTVAGTYTLLSIDGQSLPLTRAESTTLGPVTFALAKGCCAVLLESGGGYTRSVAGTASQGLLSSAVTAGDEGTYTLSGSTLRFISTRQHVAYILGTTETTNVDTTFATLESNRITFTGDATTFVTGALVFTK